MTRSEWYQGSNPTVLAAMLEHPVFREAMAIIRAEILVSLKASAETTNPIEWNALAHAELGGRLRYEDALLALATPRQELKPLPAPWSGDNPTPNA